MRDRIFFSKRTSIFESVIKHNRQDAIFEVKTFKTQRDKKTVALKASRFASVPNRWKIRVRFIHFTSIQTTFWHSLDSFFKLASFCCKHCCFCRFFPPRQNPIHFQPMRHCSLLRLRQSWGVSTPAAGRRGRWEETVSLEERKQNGSVVMRATSRQPGETLANI